MRKRKVEEVFDKHAKSYSSGFSAPTRHSTARAAMSFADDITWHFLIKYLPERKSIAILDAGCGDGQWAQRFVELGYENVTLADLSRGMLEEAKKRFAQLKIGRTVKFVKCDIARLKELEKESFDFVFSQYDAVSYSMKPVRAIKELARVAKKGAHVIVSLDTKFRRVPELIEAGLVDEAEHLLKTNVTYEFEFPQYNLTWEELSTYFVRAGLKVLEVVGAPVFMHQVNEQLLNKLEADPTIRQRLLRMELAYCTNRSLVNFAGHLQIVGQKP
jgi:ubiquinone/menaquinone biosynthesis C-methylase UbiE